MTDKHSRKRRDVPIICQQKSSNPIAPEYTTTGLIDAVKTTETPGTYTQNTTTDLVETVNMIYDLLLKLLGVLSDITNIKSQ